MENRILLDTNALLRYVLNDDQQRAAEVKEIIDENQTVVLIPVLQEAVYVLEGFYGIERDRIRRSLLDATDSLAYVEEEIIRKALDLYAKPPKLDFVDCLLLAYYSCEGIDFFSFDKKLNKVKDSL